MTTAAHAPNGIHPIFAYADAAHRKPFDIAPLLFEGANTIRIRDAVAKAYGCKSYTIRTMDQLMAALEDAKKIKNRPVLFDIKVLPKTMTDGYTSWWRVGDTEVSELPENVECWNDLQEHLKDCRKY